MKNIKSFEQLNEKSDFLSGMPDLNRDQQEELALKIRTLVYAYETRNKDMSHIPGHPGAVAYLDAMMNQAKDLMKKYKIPEAEK